MRCSEEDAKAEQRSALPYGTFFWEAFLQPGHQGAHPFRIEQCSTCMMTPVRGAHVLAHQARVWLTRGCSCRTKGVEHAGMAMGSDGTRSIAKPSARNKRAGRSAAVARSPAGPHWAWRRRRMTIKPSCRPCTRRIGAKYPERTRSCCAMVPSAWSYSRSRTRSLPPVARPPAPRLAQSRSYRLG